MLTKTCPKCGGMMVPANYDTGEGKVILKCAWCGGSTEEVEPLDKAPKEQEKSERKPLHD